ncbi:MAG TPA: DUF3052 domain-containing protein [Thermoanaerobaculia bacterium]|nr:DUF3052 domain-containing protein [Thermoanaerobaculia bacterium]
MGNEARCRIRYDGKAAEGKALLETEELILRVDARVVIPFRKVTKIEVEDGELHLAWESHQASLALGTDAAKWAEKIRNPKSRVDKIGVKPGQRVSVLAIDDAELLEELKVRGADVSTRARKGSDIIFFGASGREDLARLASIKELLQPAGALWIIRPKGTKAITEAETMAAGKAAGLVDVKVVKFSETHTAEKFVIPLPKR